MKPELLSPAGNMDCLRAAVNQGCDAVYLGGVRYNARHAAENFTDKTLPQAIDYCHTRGVRVYLTVNTLYRDDELPEVLCFAANMAAAGVDALIIQDIGFASRIKMLYPECKLHASTQMTAQTAADVLFLQQAGFDRVVLSRELSLENITNTVVGTQASGMETEVFVHGALCVSYSGQCLMSRFLGGRSGNRGECAQPCRLPYSLLYEAPGAASRCVRQGHLLSPKDMMTLDILPAIIQTGVNSLKIEGRMKSPEYVAYVTRAYRRRLDGLPPEPDEAKKLLQIFSRGGAFSTGYYQNNTPGPEAMSVTHPKKTGLPVGTVHRYDAKRKRCTLAIAETLAPGDGLAIETDPDKTSAGTGVNRVINPGETFVFPLETPVQAGAVVYRTLDKKLQDELRPLYTGDTRKRTLQGGIRLRLGEPAQMTLGCDGISVQAEGICPEAARGEPMTEAAILTRLSGMGNTEFTVHFTRVEMDKGLFIPVAALNQLRRDAVEKIRSALIARNKRPIRTLSLPPREPDRAHHVTQLTVHVKNAAQLENVLAAGTPYRVYMEAHHFCADPERFAQLCQSAKTQLFIALPLVGDSWQQWLPAGEASAADGYLIRAWGQLSALQHTAKQKVLDYTFNIYNHATLAFLKPWADYFTLSPELTVREAADIADTSCEIITYGRLPLMTTRMCPAGHYGICRKQTRQDQPKGRLWLRDRKQAVFPVETDCEHGLARIYSHTPIHLPENALQNTPFGTQRIIFFDDDDAETIRQYLYG